MPPARAAPAVTADCCGATAAREAPAGTVLRVVLAVPLGPPLLSGEVRSAVSAGEAAPVGPALLGATAAVAAPLAPPAAMRSAPSAVPAARAASVLPGATAA